MGPYFPPEYDSPPPPPVYPAQPGLLLLIVALAIVVGLVTREIVRRRRRATDRVVDDLTVSWFPADAVELARAVRDLEVDGEECVWSEPEELSFGPTRRPVRRTSRRAPRRAPRTARQRTPS